MRLTRAEEQPRTLGVGAPGARPGLSPPRDFSRRRAGPCRRVAGCALGIVAVAGLALAEPDGVRSPAELKVLSIEELINQDVVTVSRHAERWAEVPSGIVVVGSDDIRRAGAATLPQALRLAPTLQVAQVDAREWAISARGSNGTIANKLLVMIDGRTVYTPLFSGVFWDAQDVFLPDVDRIEVVSGPGGASWGANAVNGVINVVSRPAADTQGAYAYGGVGTPDAAQAGVRYGGRLGSLGHFRVYAKTSGGADSVLPDGSSAEDGWRFRQGGFRADVDPGPNDGLSIQGEVYRGRGGRPGAAPAAYSGGNVTTSWLHLDGAGGEMRTRLYYDETRRELPGTFGESLGTVDLDTQYQFAPDARQTVVVGAGFRAMSDRVRNSDQLAFLPPELTTHLYSAFAQDTLEVWDGRLRLTAAAKGEHNDFSGTDWEPSVRAAWRVAPEHTVWSAVSRAVRTPSRIDRDFFVPGAEPYTIAGGPEFESEKLWAYEVGYRGRVSAKAAATATLFVHRYYSLRTLEPGPPAVVANGGSATVQGAELSLDWQLLPTLRGRAGALLQTRHNHLKAWSRDLNAGRAEGSDPDWQLSAGLGWDPVRRLHLDARWRWVGRLSSVSDDPALQVPAYQELDARIGWELSPRCEIALVGRSLLHDRHREFSGSTPFELQRGIQLVITWQR